MGKENDLDQLFKHGLDEPDIPFNELDWERMERKLDGKEEKRIFPVWLMKVGGVAAVLALVLFWIFSEPRSAVQQTAVVRPAKAPQQKADSPERDLPASTNLTAGGPSGGSNAFLPGTPSAETTGKDTVRGIAPAAALLYTAVQHPSQVAAAHPVFSGGVNTPPAAASVAVQSDSALLLQKANALANSKDPLEKLNAAAIARHVKKGMEDLLVQDHKLILSAMAAPDLTTAKSSMPSKISSNFGVLGTYALSSKFSLTSGAVYSRKFYNSGGTAPPVNSYTSGADWEVKADCNVLDIPVNVNYKVLNRKRLSVSLNTGLSSYFMLKEKYEFITGQPGPSQQVSALEVDNQNQHLFGVANVSVSFDHKISPTLSVGVQPFAKLPLTGIGNGDVNLKSTGVSFSLNIGLFPAKKPGKYAANRSSSMLLN